MVVVTGAAGFIGSCVVSKLNAEGVRDLILVDDFSDAEKFRNYAHKEYESLVSRDEFIPWLAEHAARISYVIHLGACADTAETDWNVFERLNLTYSKEVWRICATAAIPLLYASSAATYGAGEHGYDDTADPRLLSPLNLYGRSKHEFDLWALEEPEKPPRWYGLKFFNVYGPNEYHKGRMASVVLNAFRKARATGTISLFRSHDPRFPDGGQKRDFVYVKDVAEVIWFLYTHTAPDGLYNVGTGTARTFYDLATATLSAMELPQHIAFIDMPEDLRGRYQSFTEAKMTKLRSAGYGRPFASLEDGVRDYVRTYLIENERIL